MSFYYLFETFLIIFLKLFKRFNKKEKSSDFVYILIKARVILYSGDIFLIRVLNKSK